MAGWADMQQILTIMGRGRRWWGSWPMSSDPVIHLLRSTNFPARRWNFVELTPETALMFLICFVVTG